MKKYRNRIIAGVIIVLVLVLAYCYGGDVPYTRETSPKINQKITSNVDIDMEENEDAKESEFPKEQEENDEIVETNPYKSEIEKNIEILDDNTVEEVKETKAPSESVITYEELTCTLSVRCDTILNNIQWFNDGKIQLVPKDGVIYAEKTVTFYEGESVFNVLLREMKKNKIHMEFANVPIYNSAYIEGIANLYEFDCGELSGWMYKVNGCFPNYGCSRYILKDGDKIEWVYTCDLGTDVGGEYSAKNGRQT